MTKFTENPWGAVSEQSCAFWVTFVDVLSVPFSIYDKNVKQATCTISQEANRKPTILSPCVGAQICTEWLCPPHKPVKFFSLHPSLLLDSYQAHTEINVSVISIVKGAVCSCVAVRLQDCYLGHRLQFIPPPPIRTRLEVSLFIVTENEGAV